MKKALFLMLLFLIVAVVSVSAQAGVYLFIDKITTGAGTGGHVNEIQLLNLQNGIGVSISPGPPPTPSQPNLSDYTFSKTFDKSSLRLHQKLIEGSEIASAQIRFYNGQNAVSYSITLDKCFLTTGTSNNGGDGCSTGCQSIVEMYSLYGQKITWRNFLTSPNQVLVYDVTTGQTTFTE